MSEVFWQRGRAAPPPSRCDTSPDKAVEEFDRKAGRLWSSTALAGEVADRPEGAPNHAN